MKPKNNSITLALLSFALLISFSCGPKQTYNSPAGYDLNQPEKFNMPDDLTEISGIAFNKGNAATLYSEEDEDGRVYHLKLGDKSAKFTRFKKSGDFEDIAICNGQVVMLQSKGRLYTFPVTATDSDEISNVKKFENLLTEGEYEGIAADEKNNNIYVLCKHCNIDKTSKNTSGFIFKMSPDGSLQNSGRFEINVKHITEQANEEKINFHPSAIALNPRTNEWYVLSSVNKLLVVLNDNFKVKQVFHLNPRYFPQPEGMTFDNQNNLYISNEGDKIEPGNVLKFKYSGK